MAEYVKNLFIKSNCKVDAEKFGNEFSDAIDRLAEINPALIKSIAYAIYLKPLAVACDVEPEPGNTIYYDSSGTIHLWRYVDNSRRMVASFFHEFLHFVNVKFDRKFHNAPDMKSIVELDYVYACHFAIFPELANRPELDSSRIPAARATCASARVFTFLEDRIEMWKLLFEAVGLF